MRAAPVEGEANEALRRLIAKELGIAPRQAFAAGATAHSSGFASPATSARSKRRWNGWRNNRKAPAGDAMSAKIIDGKAIAADLRAKVTAETRRLTAAHGLVPGLAVVLVGDNAASKTYVASKARALLETGMRPFDHQLPADTSEADLLALIAKLNADPAVHGILVQLPLPPQINAARVVGSVAAGQRCRRLSSRSISGGWRRNCRRSFPARRSPA